MNNQSTGICMVRKLISSDSSITSNLGTSNNHIFSAARHCSQNKTQSTVLIRLDLGSLLKISSK